MTAPVKRSRGNGPRRLTPEQLADLRVKVGLPPEGPNPDRHKAWSKEENGLVDEPTPVVDEQPADVEQQLRAEVQTVRDAFDILLRDRDELARQVVDVDQLRAAATVFDQRLDDVRTELWKHVKVQERRAEHAERRLAGVLGERDNLAEQLEKTAARVVQAEQQAHTWESEYERVRDDKLEDIVSDTRHRHAWEWQPGLKRLPLPCSCGRPWPSDRPPGGGAS